MGLSLSLVRNIASLTIELWFQTRDKTENGPFGNELRVVKSIFDAEWYNQSVFTTVFSFYIVGTYVISMNETVSEP